MISQEAGIKDMRIALRPAFFRSFKSSDRPALIRIMIRAIFRRSADIERIDGSRKSRTYGPRTIPVTSIPMILGSFNFWQIAPMTSPTRKISDKDVSIISLLKNIVNAFMNAKKADASCDIKS